MSPLGLSILFVVVWLVTFVPCWVLLLKLLAMSVSEKITIRFVVYFVLYRVLIVLPYVLLLVFGQGTLPDLVEVFVVGIVVTGLLLSFVRFFFKNNVITFLWWCYGYCYDGLIYFKPYTRLIASVVGLSSQVATEPKAILELGCGTGNVLAALQAEYPDAIITGVDNSSSMLRIAKKKNSKMTLIKSDIVEFLQTNKNRYDLIVMQNSLYAVNNRELFWKPLHSALSDEGVVVITNSDKPGSKTIVQEHLRYGRWYSLLHPKLVLVGLIDSFISQLSMTGAFSFLTAQQIEVETSPNFSMSPPKRGYGDVNILFYLKPHTRESDL